MHGSIQNRLEDLLSAARPGSDGPQLDGDLAGHLKSCSECASELAIMKTQDSMLRLLRAPGEVEPAGGFYARVMQRIEERRGESIWGLLLGSPFSSRLAYASLTLALIAGSYVVAAESRDGHFSADMVAQVHYDAPVTGSPSEQRDAVLTNFVSH